MALAKLELKDRCPLICLYVTHPFVESWWHTQLIVGRAMHIYQSSPSISYNHFCFVECQEQCECKLGGTSTPPLRHRISRLLSQRGSRGAKARESGDEGCQEEGQGQMQHCSWPLAPWNTIWQAGRTWQPFVGGKNGHENFRQARIYNFRDKCIVFARSLKFLNLTQ